MNFQSKPLTTIISAVVIVLTSGSIFAPAIAQVAADDPVARATQLFNARRYKDSLALIDSEIKRGDRRWQAYYQRGMAYKALHRSDEALADFDKATEIAPNRSEPLIQHADVDMNIMEDERAIEYLNRAIALEKGTSSSLIQRANVYENMSNYAAAVKDFETYLKGHPERLDSDVARNLGHAYFQNHNATKAVEYLTKAITMTPKIRKAHLFRGDAYLELKNYRAAAADFSVSLTEVRAPDVLLKRAQCYDALGEKTLAAKDRAAVKNISSDAFIEAPFRTKTAR